MEINLIGSVDSINEIIQGVDLLATDLGIQVKADGYPIHIKKQAGPLQVSNQAGVGYIVFEEKVQFFRGLGLWLENFQQQEFQIVEHKQFQTSGVMADVSRNAVLNEKEVRYFLRKMAVMGLDLFLLYIEDTYTLPDYPYFGYMRGRYTEEELRAFDDYADTLGIELIPSIQTLAHLATTLRWNYAREMKDTDDILLVGQAETYQFVEDLLLAATRPLRSKRIHIGMDEAMKLGLGRYLEFNGYQNRFAIMSEHLQKVIALTEKLGLEPMIWSDMFFRLGSKHNEYYDLNVSIPENVIQSIPKNVQLVYWDYYHSEEDFYTLFLQKHKDLGSLPVFAGGAWTWNGIAPNYSRAFVNSEAALKACKKENIKEVFVTMLGDNGAETPLSSALPVMQLYAEYTYRDTVDQEHLAKRFEFCTGTPLADFLLLNQFDETPGVEEDNLKSSSPSKFLLWQDIFIGLFDENIKGFPMRKHYSEMISPLKQAKEEAADHSLLFAFYEQLAQVLSRKAEAGIDIKAAYDEKDKEKMCELLEEIKILQEDVRELRLRHQRLWFDMYKPFGWEVLDIRYGGVVARLETIEMRLRMWLLDEIEWIEELEEERLPYDAKYDIVEGFLGTEKYHGIVTAGHLSH